MGSGVSKMGVANCVEVGGNIDIAVAGEIKVAGDVDEADV